MKRPMCGYDLQARMNGCVMFSCRRPERVLLQVLAVDYTQGGIVKFNPNCSSNNVFYFGWNLTQTCRTRYLVGVGYSVLQMTLEVASSEFVK